MTDYTKLFNKYNDRRQQSLPFVGTDRRKIIEDAEAQLAHKANEKAFLEGIENINGIERIA